MKAVFVIVFLVSMILPLFSFGYQQGVALEVIDGRVREIILDYESDRLVVMLFHPQCGFSRLAFSQWRPSTWQKMKQKGLFIVPTGQSLNQDITAVTEWMKQHPGNRIYLITQEKYWPQIKFDLVPSFFVLDHGILKQEIRGWPEGDSRLETLEKILDTL